MKQNPESRGVGVFVVISFLLLMAHALVAQTQPTREQDVEDSRASTALIVEDIRSKLFVGLPASEQQIYDQIVFSVSSDSAINAYATHKGGQRRVVLTEGIGRATELNTDAFLIDQMYHRSGFLGDYMNFVCTRYQSNNKRYSQGLPPNKIPSPYEYAGWTDRDLTNFYADRDINHARNVALGGAFAFILAHEVAHQIKGHVDLPHSSLSLAQRRQNETEADAWAIDLLVKKKLNPVDGMIPLLFFFFTDQHPISDENVSDHPADERRLLAMYQGLSDRLPSFRPYLTGIDYDTARKRVDISIALIKQEIAAGSKPTSATQYGVLTSSGSNSLTGGQVAPMCDGLNTYIGAAVHNFSSLRGRADPDSEGEGFYSRQGIVGFTDCEVWIYHDQSLEPSATCDATGGSIASLTDAVQACLGGEWRSRHHNGDVIFDGPDKLTIRLDTNKRGTIEIWVDSPSRD